MNNIICFNKVALFLLLVVLMAFIVILKLYFQNPCPLSCPKLESTCPPCKIRQREPNSPTNIEPERVTTVNSFITQPAVQSVVDPILEYDYDKAYHPLEEPRRRVPRHEMHRLGLKRLIDLPTRGYPDNFRQFGILIGDKKRGDNKILRLFGRQTYPGSNKYDYYTAVNTGNDQIKIPLKTKAHKELYDGDAVFVDEIEGKYTVKLHEYDYPRYYPDLI